MGSWWCERQLLPYCLKGTSSCLLDALVGLVGVAGHVGLGGLHKHLINDEFRHNVMWFGPHRHILNTEEDCYRYYCVIVEMCSKRCCVGSPASEGCFMGNTKCTSPC